MLPGFIYQEFAVSHPEHTLFRNSGINETTEVRRQMDYFTFAMTELHRRQL